MQFARQAEVEVREVDEDGSVGALAFGFGDDFMEQTKYAGKVLDDLGKTDDCDFIGVDDEMAAGMLHLTAADAEKLRPNIFLGDTRAKGIDQHCAVEFTGGLSRRNEDSHVGIMTGSGLRAGQPGSSRLVEDEEPCAVRLPAHDLGTESPKLLIAAMKRPFGMQ